MFLSVVIPFYNEDKVAADVIKEHLGQLQILSSRVEGWELVCLDDASTDTTWQILTAAAQANPRVRAIRNNANQGIVASFGRLLSESQGTHIYMTGGDGQWPAENLLALYQQWEETQADLIIGVRRKRYAVYSQWRTILSYGFNMLAWLVTGINGRDVNGIKLGRREIFTVPVKSRSFFVEIERLKKALAKGYRISQTPVTFRPRAQGKAKGARFKNIWATVNDWIAVGWQDPSR